MYEISTYFEFFSFSRILLNFFVGMTDIQTNKHIADACTAELTSSFTSLIFIKDKTWITVVFCSFPKCFSRFSWCPTFVKIWRAKIFTFLKWKTDSKSAQCKKLRKNRFFAVLIENYVTPSNCLCKPEDCAIGRILYGSL